MRSLVVTENITVDGVIEATENWFGSSGGGDAESVDEMIEVQRGHMAAADGLLVGRTTFEAFRSYWPNRHDDGTGISEYLNRVAKYVVSSTLDDPGWSGSTVLRGPVADEVAALKAAPGRDIVCTGSVRLVHALNATGLVDEYRLFVYPVVVGKGERLFPDPAAAGRLHLVESRPFPSGVVLMRYRTRPA